MLAHPIARQDGAAYRPGSSYSPGRLSDEMSGACRPDHCHQCSAVVLETTGNLEQATATTGSTTCEQRYAR
jgi:hypothetical protein